MHWQPHDRKVGVRVRIADSLEDRETALEIPFVEVVEEEAADAARFSTMKPGAIFYNIGRGTTVEQDALHTALRSGRLKAAWLDVTDPEPLPDNHPLWAEPNCHITPHIAGGHTDEARTLVRHFLRNLDRFVRGEALLDRVM